MTRYCRVPWPARLLGVYAVVVLAAVVALPAVAGLLAYGATAGLGGSRRAALGAGVTASVLAVGGIVALAVTR